MVIFRNCESPVRVCVESGPQSEFEFYPWEERYAGRHLSDAEYAELLAARPCDTVVVSPVAQWNGYANQIHRYVGVHLFGSAKVDGPSPWYEYEVRCGLSLKSGLPQLDYQQFRVLDEAAQGRGIAAHVFATQVHSMRRLGFTTLGAAAWAGLDRDGKPNNGHYTWLRLGFDGPIADRDRQRLPSFLSGMVRYSDIIRDPVGRSWWRENGFTVYVDFDTAPDSSSMATLREYFAEHSWPWNGTPHVVTSTRRVDSVHRFHDEEPCRCP